MYSKSHQGIIKRTVIVEFENGYSLTLDAGVEIGLFVAISERQPNNAIQDELLTSFDFEATYHDKLKSIQAKRANSQSP